MKKSIKAVAALIAVIGVCALMSSCHGGGYGGGGYGGGHGGGGYGGGGYGGGGHH